MIFIFIVFINLAERLHDFDIYTGSITPTSGKSFNKSALTKCAHYTGPVERGATKTLSCMSKDNYSVVVIVIPGINERLTLCEVEIFSK